MRADPRTSAHPPKSVDNKLLNSRAEVDPSASPAPGPTSAAADKKGADGEVKGKKDDGAAAGKK